MRSNVLLTDGFRKSAKRLKKKYRSLPIDLKQLVAELEENPFLGTRLSPNSYKIRLAIKSKGRGKSGGARVISYVNIEIEATTEDDEITVYLIEIYDKSEISSLPQNVINELVEKAAAEEKNEENP